MLTGQFAAGLQKSKPLSLIRRYIGLFLGIMEKKNGNYSSIRLHRSYIGIMEEKLEAGGQNHVKPETLKPYTLPQIPEAPSIFL